MVNIEFEDEISKFKTNFGFSELKNQTLKFVAGFFFQTATCRLST